MDGVAPTLWHIVCVGLRLLISISSRAYFHSICTMYVCWPTLFNCIQYNNNNDGPDKSTDDEKYRAFAPINPSAISWISEVATPMATYLSPGQMSIIGRTTKSSLHRRQPRTNNKTPQNCTVDNRSPCILSTNTYIVAYGLSMSFIFQNGFMFDFHFMSFIGQSIIRIEVN